MKPRHDVEANVFPWVWHDAEYRRDSFIRAEVHDLDDERRTLVFHAFQICEIGQQIEARIEILKAVLDPLNRCLLFVHIYDLFEADNQKLLGGIRVDADHSRI